VSAEDRGDWARVRARFEELAELPAEERARRLDQLEREAPETCRQVRELLAADHDEASLAFEGAIASGAARVLEELEPEDSAGSLAGATLGPWRLAEPIGRGGMAEVWAAARADGQFEQEVAVKLLKRGMDSDELVARFRRERQILARLDHPAIARLLDGGVAPDGRPYLVLERVDGEPITAWCERRNLPVAERLRLVVEAGRAVAAAHRQLVVHRDLKPSNLLVTGDGRVKLLDFGIAKILADDDPAAGDATRVEQRVLTPAYAAPEQIRGEPVSTATDVYSLGVLAYELVVGRLPHRRAGRGAADLAAAVDRESIEAPSTAVLAASVAETGGPDVRRERRRRARQLAGDLDTVLLTALRREPSRRYASVDAFVDDLERTLNGRPIRARRDSFGYRARKFLGRHRAATAAATLTLAALIAALAVALGQARLARRHALEAATNAHRAERVKEFLVGLFEVADPERSGGATVTAAELLDQAGRRLPQELAAEPGVQAELLETVARIERSLGRLDIAERLALSALDLRSSGVGDAAALGGSLATLGSVRLAQGQLDEAASRLEQGLGLLPADDLAAARARSDLAQVSFWREKLDEARRLEHEAWQTYRRVLGDEHVLTAIHLRNLGVIDYQAGRYAEAEPRMVAAQEVLERQLGGDHPTLAQCYLDRAALYASLDRPREAEPLYRRALEIRRRRLGFGHPATGQTLQLLGVLLYQERRWDEAEAATREALEIFRAIDPGHFEVGKAIHGLGQIAAGRGRAAEAERHFAEAVERFRAALGPDHPFVWITSGHLAQQLARQGRFEEAERRLRESRERLLAIVGADHEYSGEAANRLGTLLRERDRAAEAIPLHREALAFFLGQLGPRHPRVAESRYLLAAALAAAGQPVAEEAAAALELVRELEPASPRLAELERWAAAGGR
jgi:serine/threonine-protein kinase